MITEIPEEIREVIRTAVENTILEHSKKEIEAMIKQMERSWLAKINSKTPMNCGTFPDRRASERKWMCFSTALSEGWLMLQCKNTGAQGVVKDPTSEEWSWAFDCPTKAKLWPDASRVTVMREGRQG